MQDTLIDQGINLMLFGMGTVFVFLTVLVFATTLMSKLVNRFAPEQAQATAAEAPTQAAPASGTVSPQIIEAIKQAIAQHRQG